MLPPQTLDCDWYGHTVTPPVLFYLGLSASHVLFGATRKRAARMFPGHVPGQFVEGLWERDVFEIFLRDERSGAYQELNLSPAGAWWTAVFDAPRKRAAHQPSELRNVTAWSDVTDSGWRAAAAIPRTLIDPRIQLENSTDTTMNVCACIGLPVTYLALRGESAGTPDFHDPTGFRKYRVVD